MSDKDRLIEHSYDGIQEYDNPMPAWWVTTFWLCILFAVGYYAKVPGFGAGPGAIAEYDASMAAAAKEFPVVVASVSPEQLLAMAAEPKSVEEGKEVFTKNCVACHAADGGGLIGPNLTDDAWIHGGKIDQIHGIIVAGVLAKGMPAWGQMLKPEDVEHVTAYVWSLHGTTPAKPKVAEGVVEPR